MKHFPLLLLCHIIFWLHLLSPTIQHEANNQENQGSLSSGTNELDVEGAINHKADNQENHGGGGNSGGAGPGAPTTMTIVTNHGESDSDGVSNLHFTRGIYHVSIPENSPGKTYAAAEEMIGIFVDDPNYTVRYKILSGDEDKMFKAESRNVGDFWFLRIRTKLYLNYNLNRESKAEYKLGVRATITRSGQDEVRWKSFCEVVVHVTDGNDLSPFFYPTHYSVDVPEDVQVGTSILRVSALDADDGQNGQVYYSLLEPTLTFAIHPTLGMITITRPLLLSDEGNIESSPEHYRLTVVARDRGHHQAVGSLPASNAQVDINVIPVHKKVTPVNSTTAQNVQLPRSSKVRPKFNEKSYLARVREDIPIGTVITKIQAFFPGANDMQLGRIIYEIPDNENHYEELNHFSIDELMGDVRLTNSLDFELKQLYNVTVRARDASNTNLSSMVTLLVEIDDVNENEHSPKFADIVFSGKVAENRPIGTFVMQISAYDEDTSGRAGQIIYQIVGGDGIGRFTIDNDGNIYTSVVLDRETEWRHWLDIKARDLAPVPKSSYVSVFIDVEDEDDSPPITKKPFYRATILENASVPTDIITLEAEDRDLVPHHDSIIFEINTKRAIPFTIDSHSGLLSSSEPLDRESIAGYVIDVILKDSKNEENLVGDESTLPPSLHSRTPVLVDLIDVNDNEPRFLHMVYRCHAYTNLNTSIPICHVIAEDPDEGANSEITFSIEDPDDLFIINENTGEIFARNASLPSTEYLLFVSARDKGSPPLESTRSVKVYVRIHDIPPTELTDGNDTVPNSPPKFENLDTRFFVNENEKVGFPVALIKSKDPDGDRICTYIMGGNEKNKFAIVDSALQLARPLNFDEDQTFELVIMITDGLYNETTKLQINVVDYNDKPPKFKHELYEVSIYENSTRGTEVTRLVAYDPDEYDYLTYSIYSADSQESSNLFEIESGSGRVLLKGQLDHELCKRHSLTIEVSDSSSITTESQKLAHRSFTRLVIDVLDSNDEHPRFTSDSYKTSVPETVALGTAVLQLIAYDNDVGENADITYSIASGNFHEVFAIEPKLGYIYIVKPLNARLQPEYIMVIKATDGGNPALSSSTTAQIFVTIPDTQPPVFEHRLYSVDLKETSPVGMVFSAPKALSRQSLFYEVVKGPKDENKGTFSINPFTGELVLLKQLNARKQKTYHLKVAATNLLGLNDTVSVIVRVIGEDFDDETHPLKSPSKAHSHRFSLMSHVRSMTFNGRSAAKYLLKKPNYSKISLKLRTIQPRAVILTLKPSDNPKVHASLEMKNKRILFKFECESGEEYIISTDRSMVFNDGLWHEVAVEVNGTHISLTVDRETEFSEESDDFEISCAKFSQNENQNIIIHVGAQVHTTNDHFYADQYTHLGFIGCVDDVQIDDIPLPVHASQKSSDITLEHMPNGVEATCLGLLPLGICDSHPCQHGGSCINLLNTTFQCTCSSSRYTGSKCDIDLFSCDTSPCLNGGRCIQNDKLCRSKSHVRCYTCECPTGYDGMNCENRRWCEPNPCQNNGTCIELNTTAGFKCDCIHPFNGTYCEQEILPPPPTLVSFNETGFAQYSIAAHNYNHLYLKLKTFQSRAIIMQALPQDGGFYCTVPSYLELIGGQAQFRFDCGRGEELVRVENSPINDGEWHEIIVEMMDNLVYLTIDGTLKRIAVIPRELIPTIGMLSENETHRFEMYFGANVSDDQNLTYGLIGCMEHIRVNNQVLPLRFAENTQDIALKQLANAEHECPTLAFLSPCQSNPCFNGATCIDTDTSTSEHPFQCLCPLSGRYIGRHCEIDAFTCESQPCLNGGVCQNNWTLCEQDKDHVCYQCICPFPYEGEHCQRRNLCAPNPCENGGICLETSSGTKCDCTEGWTGTLCESKTPEKQPTTTDADALDSELPPSPTSTANESKSFRFNGDSYARYNVKKFSIEKISLRLRTVQPRAVLVYSSASGIHRDYGVLELAGGNIQFRFDCGSGEGLIRVETVSVNDGKWHRVDVERQGASASVLVDGKYKGSGSAPVLVADLYTTARKGKSILYIGAEVTPRPVNIGGEDLTLPFSGCLEDILVDNEELPIVMTDVSSILSLKRLTNVEFGCNVFSPSSCQPEFCFNNGTCVSLTNGSQLCLCPQRYTGPRCEHEIDSYHECSSERPCLNHGVCLESVNGKASCRCLPGFTGKLCEHDIDECNGNKPVCMPGTICINLPGTFKCVCPKDASGKSTCDQGFFGRHITLRYFTLDEVIGLAAIFALLVVLSCCLAVCCRCRRKSRRRGGPKLQNNAYREAGQLLLKNQNLSESHHQKPLEMCNLKRFSNRLSNIEVSSQLSPNRPHMHNHHYIHPARPTSLTDAQLMMMNNFDTLQSYGSAGDDLENIPKNDPVATPLMMSNNRQFTTNNDFIHNLKKSNPPIASVSPQISSQVTSAGSVCSSVRASQKENDNSNMYVDVGKDTKCPPSSCCPSATPSSCKLSPAHFGRQNQQQSGSLCGSDFNVFNDHDAMREHCASAVSNSNNEGYHWDCSDWATVSEVGGCNNNPNLYEVPTNEVRDDSSQSTTSENSQIDMMVANHNCHLNRRRKNPNRDKNTFSPTARSPQFQIDEQGSQHASPRSGAPHTQVTSIEDASHANDASEDDHNEDVQEMNERTRLLDSNDNGVTQEQHQQQHTASNNHEDNSDDESSDSIPFVDENSSSLPNSPVRYALHPNQYLPTFTPSMDGWSYSQSNAARGATASNHAPSSPNHSNHRHHLDPDTLTDIEGGSMTDLCDDDDDDDDEMAAQRRVICDIEDSEYESFSGPPNKSNRESTAL